MTFDLRSLVEKIPYVKLGYNVGGMFDIPCGTYLKGKHGEHILNGGMSSFMGIVGPPNVFKSTIADFFAFTTIARIDEATGECYDTETNISEARKQSVAANVDGLDNTNEKNPILNGRWIITDNTRYFANEWHAKRKEYFKNKKAHEKQITRTTPFLDRDGKPFEAMIPTITSVDSLSRFETEDVADMMSKNELGASEQNTSFMKQGASKARFINELPRLIGMYEAPYLMTAHVGKTIQMDMRAPPVKKLQYLKNGDTMKGVTDQFLFLTTVTWHCANAAPMINDGTKSVEYPMSPDDDMKGDTDLNLVTLSVLRNKNGRSGLTMQIIVSQELGVQPTLSEFHYIKTNDRFGFGGNVQNYFIELLPDVKLSRTTIRGKIDKDEKLRRAINICSEMLQMFMLWSSVEQYVCTPKQLYDDLIAKGYDWNILLNTRGWWTFDNDSKDKKPFLSTMDLLRMRTGEYHPYWLADDKKTYK